MGIYIMVTVDLVCDSCSKNIGTLNTDRGDIPTYASAVITCSDCLAKGIKSPSGSSDKTTQGIVAKAIEEGIPGGLGPDEINKDI